MITYYLLYVGSGAMFSANDYNFWALRVVEKISVHNKLNKIMMESPIILKSESQFYLKTKPHQTVSYSTFPYNVLNI